MKKKVGRHGKPTVSKFVRDNLKFVLVVIALVIAIVMLIFGESKMVYQQTPVIANVKFNKLYYLNEETGERFFTLSDAVDNAVSLQTAGTYNSNTIQVINGRTENMTVVIPEGKDIKLDLNGKTVTLDNATITNNGTFTIVDSESLETTPASIGKIIAINGTAITSSGTLTLGIDDIENVSTKAPEISGTTDGINTTGIFNFYDGAVIGPTDHSVNVEPNNTPNHYKKRITDNGNGTETAVLSNKYAITYNVNEGCNNYANSEYLDTGFKPDWSKDFVLETTINVSSLGKRYFVIGNYNGSDEADINIEIKADNTLRVYLGTGEKDQNSIETITANEDIKVTFSWNSSTKTYIVTAKGIVTNITLTDTFIMNGTSANGLRIGGADYRVQASPFEEITTKNTKLTNLYTYGTEPDILPVAKRAGYTAQGWARENLFNNSVLPDVSSKYVQGDGTEVSNNEYSIYHVNIEPNTTYKIINSGGSNLPGYAIYDSSNTLLSGENYANRSAITFTSPANASYIKLSVVTQTVSGKYDKDLFYLGKVVTDSTITSVTEDHNLYAMWTANNEIIVTFDANGGTVSPRNKIVIRNGEYGELPTPTKNGYVFTGWSYNNLPAEYQEVEYIEFYGGSYIDTGIIPSNHTTKIKFDFNEYFNNECLFGTNTGDRYYSFTAYDDIYYWGTTGSEHSGGTWQSGVHTLIYNGDENKVELDGENLDYGANITTSTNLWIGKKGNIDANLNGKVYYLKVTDKSSGNLVRNMVPCYRKLDNVIGMYDLVDGGFYTNAGTGRFYKGEDVAITSTTRVLSNENHTLTAMWGQGSNVTFDANGGTVSPATKAIAFGGTYGELPTPTRDGYTFLGWSYNNLPSEYQEVEYIEFNEGNFIDTGIIPSDHTTKIKFDFNEYYNNECLFGTEDGYRYYSFVSYSDQYYWGASDSEHSGGTWQSGVHTLIYNGNNNEVELDGEILGSRDSITASTNLCIGKRYGLNNLQGKVYYIQIIDKSSGDLVRNMIPCYRKSDNTIGMYDLVDGVFYANDGTGQFNKGNDFTITSTTHVITNNNHTLTAIWDRNLTVTFDANGGTVSPATKTVTSNGTYGELPTPIRDGYTFLGWDYSCLPSEYQEVEYIEFNEGSYIDTGIIPSNHTTEIKFDFNDYYNNECLFGTDSGDRYYHFTAYSNKYYWGTNGYEHNGGTWQSGIHTLIYNEGNYKVILDGYNLDYGVNITSSKNLWLGKKSGINNLQGKVYYVKITDKTTGDLVRNMVPCYRKLDNEIGMYDLVGRVFYTNEGIRQFNKGDEYTITSTSRVITDDDHTLTALWGPNSTVTFDANGGTVSPTSKTIAYNGTYGELPTPIRDGYTFIGWSYKRLPSAYQEVEYIEFNEGNYIDTGVIPSNHTTEIKFDFNNYYSNECLFGTNSGDLYYHFTAYNSKYYWGTSGREINNGSWTAGSHTLIYNESNNAIKLDGVPLGSGREITSTTNLWIGKKKTANNLQGKVYYVKIIDKTTGNLIRYMIPCYRISDNAIGMYDLVNGVFYENAGSGQFDMGEVLMITTTTKAIINEDHTLNAQWRAN